jgi:hypothetical protein
MKKTARKNNKKKMQQNSTKKSIKKKKMEKGSESAKGFGKIEQQKLWFSCLRKSSLWTRS